MQVSTGGTGVQVQFEETMAGSQPPPGWIPRRNRNPDDCLAVAKWAVTEYNLLTGNNLEFWSESSCEAYEVPRISEATIWWIDLQVNGPINPDSYRTYVWQKGQDSTTHNQLMYFGNIPSDSGT